MLRADQMRRIRGKNTHPELRVRQAVHALGFRFRLHRTDLPGTPDLVLPRLRKIIFVHGCFWHQHGGCRLARIPKKRLDYWLPKFERNKRRDSQVSDLLRSLGWEVLVVWECQTQDASKLAALLDGLLCPVTSSSSTSAPTSRIAI